MNSVPKTYLRFAAMIATSTLVMYGLTYVNTYVFGHVYFSVTRAYMALLMGAAMAAIMLTFMLHMHPNRRANVAIYLTSAVVFLGSLWLVRSQTGVGDVLWMKAMVPHHSIAILTSERARIDDPRVRDLADRIIEAQVAEIEEMQGYIADLQGE